MDVRSMVSVYCEQSHALTLNHGRVYQELKKIGLALEGSASAEGLGQLKASDKGLYARMLTEANGHVLSEPTVIAGDCMPALRAANGQSSVIRLKHQARRYAIVQQRVQSREVRLAHVPDEFDWVDFMTKWVSLPKFIMSTRHLSNEIARYLYFGDGEPEGYSSWS